MKPELTSRVIDQLGGTTAVADLCDCKPPSVSDWRRHGMPKARHLYLHAIRPDVVPEPNPRRKAGIQKGMGDAA